jgi:hypothetical protein
MLSDFLASLGSYESNPRKLSSYFDVGLVILDGWNHLLAEQFQTAHGCGM